MDTKNRRSRGPTKTGPANKLRDKPGRRATWPIALTVAGSDSGGGAGIQADLKAFASLAVHGTSAITCVTAQNPEGVLGIQPCTPEMVHSQIQAVLAELPPRAVKTGMLYSTGIIRAVARAFRDYSTGALVVDPVMVSTSGAKLLEDSAVRLLEKELLPLCSLVTPNLDEASLLCGKQLREVEDLRWAARELHNRFGCAALVKGGHLKGLREAVDIYFDGEKEILLSAPFTRDVSTHGTGCTYSAAITAYLALGESLTAAVCKSKEYISQAIAQSTCAGRHTVLNCFWRKS